MTCPFCQEDIRGRERSGNKCGKCGKVYVFDPKTNPLGLHDLRVRRHVDKLRAGRGLRFTTSQLWLSLARKQVAEPTTPFAYFGCYLGLVVGAVIIAVSGWAAYVHAVPTAVASMVVVTLIVRRFVRPGAARGRLVSVAMLLDAFAEQLWGVWPRLHGGPVEGLVDDSRPAGHRLARPERVLLCPVNAATACLVANGVPQRLNLHTAQRLDQVPPGLPVLILRDASVVGQRFAARAVAALGPRAVDLGLTPAQARADRHLPRLKGAPVAPETLGHLGLSEADTAWLAEGWWVPLASVRPAKLIAAVEKSVARTDPDHAAAAAVGFLTWPGSAR
ncbi:hypothetical protein [Actinokineospora pegani]|uniref:hypothetical protein n=1 Tax=Actinokineospora pegani TaxID=2654637 RepID=UPI0012EA6E92|nr:hypothetical protein [Actinokineospora pegani]